MKKIGLYIHIPFCNGKCPYCDFYSVKNSSEKMDEYIFYLNQRLMSNHGKFIADTVYFGGGTPGLLGTERIVTVLKSVWKSFGKQSRETTIEINPESAKKLDFEMLKYFGIDRVSMGLQSADENELKKLGRKHNAEEVSKAVDQIRKSGINNISLDLMLGISGQSFRTLENSINFCSALDVTHISAYILKIEQGTPYYNMKETLDLPDEDTVCDFYEYTADKLENLGYKQYEISNFSKPGFESRHNLKYWRCEEYLGIGSSAHSFIDKKRFFYDRSFENFYHDIKTADGCGGDEEEYIAMVLRLNEGLDFHKFKEYFGYDFPEKYVKNAEKLKSTKLIVIDGNGIKLTRKGFLCSNSIIVNILK